jgi:hypothetical protein
MNRILLTADEYLVPIPLLTNTSIYHPHSGSNPLNTDFLISSSNKTTLDLEYTFSINKVSSAYKDLPYLNSSLH